MSEDRIHGAELENCWGDLHNGSEDQKPTNQNHQTEQQQQQKQ